MFGPPFLLREKTPAFLVQQFSFNERTWFDGKQETQSNSWRLLFAGLFGEIPATESAQERAKSGELGKLQL